MRTGTLNPRDRHRRDHTPAGQGMYLPSRARREHSDANNIRDSEMKAPGMRHPKGQYANEKINLFWKRILETAIYAKKRKHQSNNMKLQAPARL